METKTIDEAEYLRGYIKQAVPFLEEAWKACFNGNDRKLLSAEERGMGQLLGHFRAIAAGEHPTPPGCITYAECAKRTADLEAWTHRTLGNPNELVPELRRWVTWGETCADGLRKANARVEELERAAPSQPRSPEGG